MRTRIHRQPVHACMQGYAGEELYYRLYNSFGYLKTEGFYGHKFAILVGEIGSKLEDARDIQSLNDMSAWFQAKPNTGAAHSPVQARLPAEAVECRSCASVLKKPKIGHTGGLVDGCTQIGLSTDVIAWR